MLPDAPACDTTDVKDEWDEDVGDGSIGVAALLEGTIVVSEGSV